MLDNAFRKLAHMRFPLVRNIHQFLTIFNAPVGRAYNPRLTAANNPTSSEERPPAQADAATEVRSISAVNIRTRTGSWNTFDRFTPRAVTRRISPAVYKSDGQAVQTVVVRCFARLAMCLPVR